MLRPYRILLIVIIAAPITAAIYCVAKIPPQPGVTKANFDRVECGMTEAEVAHIFGGVNHTNISSNNLSKLWYDDQGMGGYAIVIFDGNGMALQKEWRGVPAPVVVTLRRRFPWLPF